MKIFLFIFGACFSKITIHLLFPVKYIIDRKRNLLFVETVNSGSYIIYMEEAFVGKYKCD